MTSDHSTSDHDSSTSASTDTRDPLTLRLMTRLADALAWAVGLHRDITRVPLTDEEAEELGLPEGASVPAVYASPLGGLSWWVLDAWTDEGDGKPGDQCLNVYALGVWVRVFSEARRPREVTA
ncbi:hypothetical protein [Pseudaquabacterium rugosum]|uniref:Uncharacterized protein n=1 Tax=Pseudaquabacterium rugosum TaxID=2984194 RepID=A0ABU9B3Y0_9BURK